MPLDRRALLEDFEAGFKPRTERLVGLEYELIGVRLDDATHLPYDGGPVSVTSVLERLIRDYGWRAVGGPPLLELEREGSRITLEPGAQLELSARPHRTLRGAHAELRRFLAELRAATEPLGAAWLPLGMQPVSPPDRIALIPKPRYEIMNRYLPTRGAGAVWMMRTTAGVQVNLDVFSPEEAARGLRLALLVSSPVVALLANSPVSEGAANGFMSKRAASWLDVDSDRCGLPPRLLSPGLRASDYVDWALEAGMFFVERDGRLVDMTGVKFREFLERGARGQQASLADWKLHLTTLFPEARLKSYLEIRCADGNPPDLALAFAALATGLIYGGSDGHEAVESLLGGFDAEARIAFHMDCARRGPAARAPDGRSAAELMRELLRLAAAELERRSPEDRPLLAPLEALAEEGRCPAMETLERWERDGAGAVAALAAALAE
ncbi:MAG: glutamate--cysteine ligase [Acidobacteria bacterium]|nr:MAG: glutamate--cysteine ligase [Acidobacteriota bacterium]